ncbi:MAG: YceD family protein [Bacteroidota bacterium]
MSKLEFNIVEIPEGESRRTVELTDEDLDLSPYEFQGGFVDLQFYRTLHFIRVNFNVDSDVELVCDRSLEPFIQPIESDYEVVFKVDVQEETEDENGAVRRFNFSSNTLSVEDEVRDTILLNIPVKKVHPKFLDEKGRPKEFETKSFGNTKEDTDAEVVDPRWEKLKKLKN